MVKIIGQEHVYGNNDENQLIIQANSVQTNDILVVTDATNNNLLTLDNSGNLTVAGYINTSSVNGIVTISSSGVLSEGMSGQTILMNCNGTITLPPWYIGLTYDIVISNAPGNSSNVTISTYAGDTMHGNIVNPVTGVISNYLTSNTSIFLGGYRAYGDFYRFICTYDNYWVVLGYSTNQGYIYVT